MLAGYVTYDELKLITGYNDTFLKDLLREGVKAHAINIGNRKTAKLTEVLYNLEEVERYLILWL